MREEDLPAAFLDAQLAHQAWVARVEELNIRHRRQLRFFEAIVCNCTPWPMRLNGLRVSEPPQLGCPVHMNPAVCSDGVIR